MATAPQDPDSTDNEVISHTTREPGTGDLVSIKMKEKGNPDSYLVSDTVVDVEN